MILESITLAGVAAVAAQISPFITIGKNATDLVKSAAQWKQVENARELLRRTRETLPDARHGHDLDKFLDHWLDHGEMIYPYVRQKLINRFIVAVGIIISAQIGAAELRGISIEDTKINIAQILVQMAAALIVNRHTIINQDEKTFLGYLTSLRKIWYETYVLPTVKVFNENLVAFIEPPAIKRTEWFREYGAISMRFQEAQKEQQELLERVQRRLLKAMEKEDEERDRTASKTDQPA